MQSKLSSGSQVTVVGATAAGVRRLRVRVSGVLVDHLVLDAGPDGVGPVGDRVSLLAQGRLFECEVARCQGSELTVSIPDGIEADDRRTSRRIATSLPASLRSAAPAHELHSAVVVDLSMGGARLLTEAPDVASGDEIEVMLGRIASSARVCHVVPHTHDGLRLLGIQLHRLAPTDRSRLLETVGALRAGMHRWV